jgi:hypothetical protein
LSSKARIALLVWLAEDVLLVVAAQVEVGVVGQIKDGWFVRGCRVIESHGVTA